MTPGLTVTELHTQDGWDWPNGVGDERWPAASEPKLICPACGVDRYKEGCQGSGCRFIAIAGDPQPLPDAYWKAMKALGEEL